MSFDNLFVSTGTGFCIRCWKSKDVVKIEAPDANLCLCSSCLKELSEFAKML